MIRKIGLVVGLICILVGCQGQKFLPESFAVPVIQLAPLTQPPVDEASFLGTACEADEPSHVIERDKRFRSCVDGTWKPVGKEELESRVVTYTVPHVELVGAKPVGLGAGARYGQCLYSISYTSEFMERQFVDKVIKLEYDWVLKISVRQDKPTTTAVDCEIQSSEAALAVIQQNWNIDPDSQKILGRKRSDGFQLN